MITTRKQKRNYAHKTTAKPAFAANGLARTKREHADSTNTDCDAHTLLTPQPN